MQTATSRVENLGEG
jgi:hypothetical protein